MGRFEGKVACVTGAARGIGAAIATRFADEGAKVVLCDLLEAEGSALAAALRDAGRDAHFMKLDVACESDWQRLIGEIDQHYGRLDVLVNNAGILAEGDPENVSVDAFARILEVNVTGTMLGIRAGIRRLKSAGGSIINVSSVTSDFPLPSTYAYSASKAAITNLTKAAALHCCSKGYPVRINMVKPGVIKTPMLTGPQAELASEQIAQVVSAIPMGRIADPSEVAGAVVFLASEEAGYITGSEITVDGGYCLA